MYDFDHRLPFVALVDLRRRWWDSGVIANRGRANAARRAGRRARCDAIGGAVDTGLLFASWCATFTASGLVTAVRSVYPVRIEALASTMTDAFG